jgi:dihydroxy-acid dehydratase
MLYATDGIYSDDDFNKAMVGVASVWRVVFSFICSRRG